MVKALLCCYTYIRTYVYIHIRKMKERKNILNHIRYWQYKKRECANNNNNSNNNSKYKIIFISLSICLKNIVYFE